MSSHHVSSNSTGQSSPTAQDQTYRAGVHMWQQLLTVKDHDGRPLNPAFLDLPSREMYPDYYTIIKSPIALNNVRDKLMNREYSSIDSVRDDLNQVLRNAKLYNARGSGIYLDAKQLQRNLKDTYAQLTNTAPDPDTDDELLLPSIPSGTAFNPLPTLSTSVAPDSASFFSPGPSNPVNGHGYPDTSAGVPNPRQVAGTSSVNVTPLPVSVPGTSFAKRGPTIKPWLTRKLAETTALSDAAGRKYSSTFQSLPDKKIWQEYYRVIQHPMSFDQVANKVNKRLYQSVQHFIDDVNLIFTNAQKFNASGTPVHHDALVLQAHFADVMKEVPPTFIPPRKYNTAKRRAEQEAMARNDHDSGSGAFDGGASRKRRRMSRDISESVGPEDDRGESDDGDYYEGSVPPSNSLNPFGLPSPASTMKVEESFMTTGQAFGTGSPPVLTPLPMPPLQPSLQMSASYGFPGPINTAAGLGAGGGQAPPLPIISRATSGHMQMSESQKPRMVAKAAGGGPQAYMTHIQVESTPADSVGKGSDESSAKKGTSNTTDPPKAADRQPDDIGTISSSSKLAISLSLSNEVAHQHAIALPVSCTRALFTPRFRTARSGAPLPCTVTVDVRPASATATATSTGASNYEVTLAPNGLTTVVEFVVQPRTATDDAGKEVYRCFVQRI